MLTVADFRDVLEEALPEVTLLEDLETGGQGLVICGEHATHGPVAVKVLNAGQPPAATERFRSEIDLLSRMRSPHIIRILEHGVAGEPPDAPPYFLMPLIVGKRLDTFCVEDLPNVRECVELFVQICTGLAHAHDRGVIHRDLKPGNILVSENGHVYIVDFGLGSVTDGAAISRSLTIRGTTAWLAPEQVEGQSCDVRVDIYGLGLLMYDALAGELPYDVNLGPSATYNHILHTEPRNLLNVRPDAGRDLAAIISKCLRKKPDERYRSTHEVRDDLERWQRGEAVAARKEDRRYRWKKAARRHKWAVAVAIAVAGMACFSTFMWQLAAGHARLAKEHAARAQNATRVAHATLQVGGYLRDGSVQRDQGRVDQAIELFLSAVDLGESLESDDPFLQRHLYGAHHRLGELYLAEAETLRSVRHVLAALKIADSMSASAPDSIEWTRLRGFSEVLRGRAARANKDHQAALIAFSRSVAIRRQLLLDDEGNVGHKADLANALALTGRTLRKLKLMDESLACYTEEYDIRSALSEADPSSGDHSLNHANACAHQASWHMVQKTHSDDREALDWITRADVVLDEMNDAQLCDNRPAECRMLRGLLKRNRDRVQKRLAASP